MSEQTGKPNASIDRVLTYRWLAGLFAAEITIKTLKGYHQPEGQAFLEMLAGASALLPLVTAIRDLAQDTHALDSRILDLAAAFGHLFLGSGGPRSAPPYASAYLSPGGILFRKPAEESSNLLRRLDLSITNDLHEPPDHVAVQLSLLAEFAMRTARAEDGGGGEAVAEQLGEQVAFMDDHLLSWLPAFRDDCVRHDGSGFYANLAQCAVAFLEADRTILATLTR